MHVKAFIVNKCLKPFFLEQHINIVDTVSFKAFGLSVLAHICFHNKQASKLLSKSEHLKRQQKKGI